MIEYLKDAPKFILIPSIILYAFGFIVINSYLARFGIVSFEIINARYAIAGIYPIFGLGIIVYLAWMTHASLPLSSYFDIRLWRQRYFAQAKLIAFAYVSAGILVGIMTIGKYRPISNTDILKFHHFPINWDYIGEKISNLTLSNSASIDYISKATLYLFSYVFLFLLAAALILIIWHEFKTRYFFKSKEVEELSKTEPANQPGEEKVEKQYLAYQAFIIISIDFLMASLFVALILYSSGKMGVETFDFPSLGKTKLLTTNIVFAWIFTSTITVYTFFNFINLPIRQEKLNLDLIKKFPDFNNFQVTFQQLIIPVLIALTTFGTVIFPRIPIAMGGGEPRHVNVVMTDTKANFSDEDLYMLGENSQYVFVAEQVPLNGGRAFEVSKDDIYSIETKSSTTTEASPIK